jgi:hypothetical protein
LRNEKRLQSSLVPKVLKESGRRDNVWTKEETRKLEELQEKYAGNRRINVLIASEIGSKNSDQVKNKRALLGKKHKRERARI